MKNYRNSGMLIILLLLIVRNFLNGGLSDPKSYFLGILTMIPGMIIGLSCHEFGHAWVSNKLGDPTPATQGRVTLNPLAHVDPLGLVALIFCGFGWGKPVEIDPRYYKNPRRDELLVSLAGVFNNLLLAILFSFLLKGLLAVSSVSALNYDSAMGILLYVVYYAIFINIVLMIFNLIPVPPLDGFGVITQLFNLKRQSWYYKVYSNGFLILMVLLLFGIVGKILTPLTSGLFDLLLTNIVLA